MIAKNALRRPGKSVVALGVAGAAALGLSLAVPPAHASSATSNRHEAKPTIVLVHGAFVDASSWDSVIGRLQHDGYKVVAPANPLRGLASDASYIHSVLKTIKGPIILAGHSYGGSVISQAAAGDRQVKALVYIAALAPAKGESVASLGARFPGAKLGTALVPLNYALPGGVTGTELYVAPDKFHDIVAPDLPQSIDDIAAAAQRPANANIFTDKATVAAWKWIPSWDLITTQDQAIAPSEQRFMAARAHAHTLEVNASHAVALSHPDAVTQIIEQAARATVR